MCFISFVSYYLSVLEYENINNDNTITLNNDLIAIWTSSFLSKKKISFKIQFSANKSVNRSASLRLLLYL